jgi:transposase-like protein
MTETRKTTRARYTLEFKQKAVRLVESGQSIAAAARQLGVVEQTLFNWVKAQREGTLKGAAVAGQSVPSRWRSAVCEPNWHG